MDIEFLLVLATKSGGRRIRLRGAPSAALSDWNFEIWLNAHLTPAGIPSTIPALPPDFRVDFYPLQALQTRVLDGILPLKPTTRVRDIVNSPVLIGICSDVETKHPPVLLAAGLSMQARDDEEVLKFIHHRTILQQLQPAPIDACEELRCISNSIRHWLGRQPAVKEESLTDRLLFEMSERLPFVIYRAFTRHQEARETGADWEWWILYPNQYIRIRVQAKKLSATEDNYPELARTNRFGLQIDMLLDNARRANAIALYALYTSDESTSMCENEPLQRQDGVFLAGAIRLYTDFIAGGRGRVLASEMLARANPFSCFACCPLMREGAGPMAKFLSRYYPSEVDSSAEGHDEPRGFHSELPGYVTSLLEHAKEGTPIWWEREFGQAIREFNNIVVYDYRDESS